MPLRFRSVLVLALTAISPLMAGPVFIDASAPVAAPAPLAFSAGGESPDHHVLGANSRTLLRDGHPWLPIMGEFHFSRYPASEWDRELRKMKAGGVDIVSSYLFWIFHEEQRGRFDWSGQRDVRRFVEACRRNGLYVWLRIGPWAHGEVRNGGLPDWVIADGPVRQNNPVYLAHVRDYFNAIGEQVRGEMWSEGGPVIGLQLENEYHPAEGGEAHLAKLLELAQQAGIHPPFYSITGWDRAVIPTSPFLPVFGGYTDQFWGASREDLPPNQNFFFTPIHAEDNVSPTLQPIDAEYQHRTDRFPFLTAELGGGMATAYHRRPVMFGDDETALAICKLGSGVSLLGYYMYHGGTNPDAAEPIEETLSAWQGYNDLETKSYDFQAPLGETGEARPSYFALRELHLFAHDFGEDLAPMVACFPRERPPTRDDVQTPRVALRTDGRGGFVFLNNYQRLHPLPAHADFQVTVHLADGDITLPTKPITLPPGTHTFWPINLRTESALVRSATAQPICRLENPRTYVFAASPGAPVEFVLAPTDGTTVEAPGAKVEQRSGMMVIGDVPPQRGAAITLRDRTGHTTDLIVLSAEDALALTKLPLGGRDRLVLSPDLVFPSDAGLAVEARGANAPTCAVYPALESVSAPFRSAGPNGVFKTYTVDSISGTVQTAPTTSVRAAEPVPTVRMNPDPKRPIALAPTEDEFSHAAEWAVALPAALVAQPGDAVLRIRYEGDVAQLYAGNRLLTDNYYKGTPFAWPLARLTADERKAGLTLRILPLRRDAPIYLMHDAWPDFHADLQIGRLLSATIETGVTVELAPAAK